MTRGRRTGRFKYWLGRAWFRLQGWQFQGELPPSGRFILVCAPHTSNWDLIYLLAVMFMFRIKVSWLGKHTIFKKPFGGFMRWLGGIPVDRTSTHGVVDQIAEYFEQYDNLIIAVTPEGTRRKTDHWKSGFYHIAVQAQVPILLGFVDFAHKRAGTGFSFIPQGDLQADMDRIREFYQDMRGANPEQESNIILQEEQN